MTVLLASLAALCCLAAVRELLDGIETRRGRTGGAPA